MSKYQLKVHRISKVEDKFSIFLKTDKTLIFAQPFIEDNVPNGDEYVIKGYYNSDQTITNSNWQWNCSSTVTDNCGPASGYGNDNPSMPACLAAPGLSCTNLGLNYNSIIQYMGSENIRYNFQVIVDQYDPGNPNYANEPIIGELYINGVKNAVDQNNTLYFTIRPGDTIHFKLHTFEEWSRITGVIQIFT